ncbi:sphingosine kinase [Thraustotheca clavata]|uniref:Sphingosine kinase n=1 Tax=Thraustotheca clavata TaxID=74557 RepID=A0A1V9Z1L3_9STRA|nr:sphingosine kinase [Thraustotheca clavata]
MISSNAFTYSRHEAIVSASLDGFHISVPKKPKMDVVFQWKDVLGASTGQDSALGGENMPLTVHVFEKHKNGKRRLRDVVLTSSNGASGTDQHDVECWLKVIQYFACPMRDPEAVMPTLDEIIQKPPKQRKFLVLINPIGGTGKGEKTFEKIRPILMNANILIEKVTTERAQHAVDIAENFDLTAYDCIVVVGGDGFAYEVIQGFMKRKDWADAIRFPFGVIPAGSGNGLAKTMAEAAGELCLPENCTYFLAKGKPLELDLATLRTTSFYSISYTVVGNPKESSFIFLSLSWAFLAEVDIESEKYRYLGSQRFTFATIAKIMSSKGWNGKFTYLEAPEDDIVPNYWDLTENHGQAPQVSLLPAFGELPKEGWKTIEGAFSLFWAMNVSHAALDAHVAPMAKLNDGHIYVVIMEGKATKGDYLNVMLALEKGQHIEKPCVKVIKTRAFELETPEGDLLSADGERYAGGLCQVEVHRGMARVMGILK